MVRLKPLTLAEASYKRIEIAREKAVGPGRSLASGDAGEYGAQHPRYHHISRFEHNTIIL
jgi:hypothetical protein